MKFFALTFSLLFFSFVANASDWRKIDSKDAKILFSPIGTGNWTPGISVSVNDDIAGRGEWKCWRGLKQPKVNSCITYHTIPDHFFKHQSASGIHAYYEKSFKGADYKPKGSIFSADSSVGDVSVSFGEMTYPHKKECFTFATRWDGGTSVIDGWYCAAEGDTISKNLVYKMIASIGIKGEYEPLNPSSIKQEKTVTSSSSQMSGDKVSKLKEAKDLFTRELINKEEYEKLKKQILGLN